MSQNYLTMDPGEEILFTASRHWINIFPILFSTALLLAFVGYALGWLAANPTKVAGLPVGALAMLLFIVAFLAVLISVISYLIFRQNRVTLTNRHYLQITQTGLFNRTVSKLTLDEIQDCKGVRKGIFATLLGYGQILIETAGEDENFDFGPIADPLNVAEIVNDAHQKYGHHQGASPGLDTSEASNSAPQASSTPVPPPPGT